MSAASRFVQARVMFDYYVKKIRVVGLAWTARWIARRLALEVLWLALLPATLVAHLLGYRRVPMNVRRIGHLACEFDALLKEQQLGSLHARKWFVLAPQGDVCNPCLLDYWAQLVPVVRRPWQCLLLESMGRHGLMMLDSDRCMGMPTTTAYSRGGPIGLRCSSWKRRTAHGAGRCCARWACPRMHGSCACTRARPASRHRTRPPMPIATATSIS
jgi:hypothetical protein